MIQRLVKKGEGRTVAKSNIFTVDDKISAAKSPCLCICKKKYVQQKTKYYILNIRLKWPDAFHKKPR